MADVNFTIFDPDGSGRIETLFADGGSGSYAEYTAEFPWYAINVTTATTSSIKSTAGVLGGIIVNKAVANGVIKLVHSGSNSIMATVTNPAVLLMNQYALMYNCFMPNGIKVITSSTDDITILWR